MNTKKKPLQPKELGWLTLRLALLVGFSSILTALSFQGTWVWFYRRYLAQNEPQWLLRTWPWLPYLASSTLAGFALTFITMTLIKIVFETSPKGRIVDDPEYELEHNGVDSPSMNHLEYVLWSCDGNDGGVQDDLRLFHIPAALPAIKLVPVNNLPSEEQIDSAEIYKQAT